MKALKNVLNNSKKDNEDENDYFCNKITHSNFKKRKDKKKYSFDDVYKEKDKNKYLSYNKESTLSEIIAINKFLNSQKPNLINHSVILKEYQKGTKLNNFLDKFFYGSFPDSYLKLRYRASEYRKLKNKDFEKIYKETQWPTVVMKTSINFYFIQFSDLEKNRYPPRALLKFYLFDFEDYILLEDSFDKIIHSYEKENLIFYNNFSSGEFIKEIKFKNKKIPKGMKFTVEDAEIFALRNKEKEKELKNFIPIHSHLRHLNS